MNHLKGWFFVIYLGETNMAADGHSYGNRITNFSHSTVHSVVLDAVLNTPTYWNRLNGQGMNFNKPTMKYTVKVSRTNQGQAYSGLEKLNASATDDTIQLEFNHTAYTHPAVKVMLEHFAVENQGEDINLSDYINQDAVAEINESLGSLIYSGNSSSYPNGLEKIVDDGTNSATIGGQSRSTYTMLKSTVTASAGTVSLSKMAKLFTDVSSGAKKPTIGLTTETVWNYLEELIQPQTRGSYSEQGYGALGIRSKYPVRSEADLKGALGFTAIFYRGLPIISDEFCTSGNLYFLNENYLNWYGRTSVPRDFKEHLKAVTLGKSDVLDLSYKPSDFHGWFYQKDQMMPDQAGLIGRYHVIGQVVSGNPRYHGKLTGILGV
jgi:hypothetical protein